MIKCPNCGSSAQVKEDKTTWEGMFDNTVHHYTCGCGCDFMIRNLTDGRIYGEFFVGEIKDVQKFTDLFQS